LPRGFHEKAGSHFTGSQLVRRQIEHIGDVPKTVQDVTSRAALDKARARNRRVLQRALQQKRHIELLTSAMQSQRKSAKSQHRYCR
jgi:phage FluMu protein gp41